MKIFRRYLLVLLAVALVFALLIAFWYAEENYRGAHMWAETQRQLQVRGESLDAARFIPPPVPDEQNLAMAPLFVWLYQYEIDPTTKLLTFKKNNSDASGFVDIFPYGSGSDSSVKRPTSPDWTTARPLDLAGLQTYYRARPDFPHAVAPQAPADDVLLALTRFDKTLNELMQAEKDRPLVRFPVNWTQNPPAAIALPHGNFIMKINHALRVRACAELTIGRSDDALRDLSLGLKLGHAIGREPTLISNLIEITCLGIQWQPIWEGLSSRRWSAEQLTVLQTRLQEMDLLGDYQRTVRGERALFIVPTLAQLHGPDGLGILAKLNAMNSDKEPPSRRDAIYYKLMPGGWSDRAVALTCEIQQKAVIDCINSGAHRFDVVRFKKRMQEITALPPWPSNVLAKIVMPVYSNVALKNVRAQFTVDVAVVACALERFYLEHHNYPTALAGLVPAYLPQIPNDVIDGAPLRYAETADGRYKLWSVGWDGVDEQGKVVWKDPAKPNRLDDEKGDWVWQYEPLTPP